MKYVKTQILFTQVTHNDGSAQELLQDSLKRNTHGLHERLRFEGVWKDQVSYRRIINDVPSGFTYFSQQSYPDS